MSGVNYKETMAKVQKAIDDAIPQIYETLKKAYVEQGIDLSEHFQDCEDDETEDDEKPKEKK